MLYKPHSYQDYAEDRLLTEPIVAGFMDMGLGKTVTVLSAFDRLMCGLSVKAMLVVAPIRVVTSVWPAEIQKWDHLDYLRWSIIRKSPISRPIKVADRLLGGSEERMSKPNEGALEALEKDADVYLTNYENLPALCMWMDKQKTLPFDMLVCDESSKMKASQSKRFKALRRHLHRFKRRVILTGTPTPNSLMDLWSQIYILDEGSRLSDYVSHYRSRYFDFNPYSHKYKLKDWAEAEITKKIKSISIVLRAEDHLKLPPVIENPIKVPLPPSARKLYDQFEKELLIRLKTIDVEAFNAAGVTGKCRQLTSGAVYETVQPGQKKTDKWEEIHEAKMEAVQDIVDEALGAPVLVVYEFRHELDRLRKLYPKAPWIGGGSKDPDRAMAEWNAGKHEVMLVHPASIGFGTNLQQGGRMMVWTSMTWSYDDYWQMVKRLHRQGQKGTVFSHMLVMPGTVDEVVWATLRDKRKGQASLLAALKAHLRKAA